MRIPPHRIHNYLTPNVPVRVQTSDFACFNSAMPYTDVLALAARGEVEAITRGSKVKYLRLLTESEKPPRLIVEEVPGERFQGKQSSRSVVAQTNMGVYREEVASVAVDEYGLSERQVIGHIWAFCALRGR